MIRILITAELKRWWAWLRCWWRGPDPEGQLEQWWPYRRLWRR